MMTPRSPVVSGWTSPVDISVAARRITLNVPTRLIDLLGLEDLPPGAVGAGTNRAQDMWKDGAGYARAGTKLPYPSDGKGFFKQPPSICAAIKALIKPLYDFLSLGNDMVKKYHDDEPKTIKEYSATCSDDGCDQKNQK